ncbi:DinB family protein [Streptomyces cinnamoneus]|uniref:DinB family protein n=1 Tax=Streptomyces cinnamoneus TaxID=53446 RepID=UPI0034429D5B
MISPERIDPPTVADERTALEGFLDYHRATLALKCAGLDDVQLRDASAPPSSLTLLGLVRHMADVERHWFRRMLAGETEAGPIHYTDEDLDGDFRVSEGDSWEGAFAVWQGEVDAAREVARGRALDDLSVGTRANGDHWDLRWIFLHMIEEYARHNGHADLIRERIDGATGE